MKKLLFLFIILFQIFLISGTNLEDLTQDELQTMLSHYDDGSATDEEILLVQEFMTIQAIQSGIEIETQKELESMSTNLEDYTQEEIQLMFEHYEDGTARDEEILLVQEFMTIQAIQSGLIDPEEIEEIKEETPKMSTNLEDYSQEEIQLMFEHYEDGTATDEELILIEQFMAIQIQIENTTQEIKEEIKETPVVVEDTNNESIEPEIEVINLENDNSNNNLMYLGIVIFIIIAAGIIFIIMK